MKKSIKQRMAAIGTAAVIAGTALLATAPAAQAANIWKYTYAFDGYGRCVAFAWYDYSWAEEVFQGQKDGPRQSHYVGTSYCR